MIKLLRYLKPYWLSVLATVVLIFVQVMASLQLPDYMAQIVNQGVVGGDNGIILRTGLVMLVVSLIGAVGMIGASLLASRTATSFAADIREKLFSRVESFSLAEFASFSTASLITRSTNDIQQIQMVMVLILRMVLMAPITGVGAIIKAYQLAPSMSWVIALAVIVMAGIIGLLFSIALPRFRLLQNLVDRLNLVARENLTGLRVIRAFDREAYEEGKFERANRDLTAANLFVNRLMAVMQPAMMLVFNATALAVIWVGAHEIDAGSLQIGDMLAFMQYAMQVIFSFLMVSIVFIMIPRASVSASRVEEVLASLPTIVDPEKPQRPAQKNGEVEFRDVSFSYPGADAPVLAGVSFTARPGETTAIVGGTGSGKSTLVSLIPRLYDVTAGQVLVDGVDVRQQKLDALYAKIGYVPQKAVLFSGTVEGTIRYGAPEAPEEAVRAAARLAQASEFIEKMEGGYQSPISQGGTNVSGGQKQRLSIARAVARDPEIYIFDDSFSALDFRTDARLRQALASEITDKTVLIVAQRISTVRHAERIVVMDEGKVVGQGTHDELMKNCLVYREIALSQLTEEELAEHSPAARKEAA